MLTAEATAKTMDAVTGGRSLLPEDAEGWVLGRGTGRGPGAVGENSHGHITSWYVLSVRRLPQTAQL